MRPLPRVLPAALALAALFAAAPADAQSVWLDRAEAKTIHLEIAKPMLESDLDDFLTTSWYASTRLPLSTSLWFVVELPFATADLKSPYPFGGDHDKSSTIGNPYVGIETRPAPGGGPWIEVGVRPPLASEDEAAAFTGVATDIDRWEAFFPNVTVVRAALHGRTNPAAPVGADFRLAPAMWFSEDFTDDVEMFLTYGMDVLYHGTSARAGGGIGGRLLVTEEGDFSERSTHQFEAAADFLAGAVRPGVTLRVPFDDDTGADVAVGVTLNVVLR